MEADVALQQRRRRRSSVIMVLSFAATVFGARWLCFILATLLWNGVGGLSLDVFTDQHAAAGQRRRPANAIVGSLFMTFVGVVVGTPIGLLAGTYMAEYGRNTMLTEVVRFVNDILLSAPSIVVGLFVYEIVVVADGPLLGLGGWHRAGHARGAGRRADDGEHAAPRPQHAARGRRRRSARRAGR